MTSARRPRGARVERNAGEPGIRILIVDDQRLFAEAIELTLRTKGFDIVAVATTGERAIEDVREHQPDVVLLDIGLPDQSGIVVGRRILEEWPATKLIALTALEDTQMVREALRVGFGGYLSKDTQAEHFERAIRSVVDGQVVVPQKFINGVGPHVDEQSTAQHELLAQHLTPRERQVLGLLAEGAASLRIAKEMGISPNTVRTHVQGILSKLQVHTRLEAAAFAVRNGLVDVRS